MHEAISICSLSLEIKFCSNKDGSRNLAYPKGFLHSRHSPREEARRFARELCQPEVQEKAQCVLVVGLGWGYLAEELLKVSARTSFFFFEPIKEVYQILAAQGRSTELRGLGIELWNDFEALKKKIGSQVGIHLSINPTYGRLFPDLFGKLLGSLKKEASSIDQRTAQHFLRQWTRNAFRLVASQRELCFFSGQLPGQQISKDRFPPPLIVYCGAAPSLLQEIGLLPPQAFIIAADTALAPLFAHSKQVDLAICVDSGHATFYHLRSAWRCSGKRHGPLDCPVLTWSGGLPGLDTWFSQVYHYRSSLPFDQILGAGPLSGLKEWKNPARNPLGLALRIAHLLGAQELYYAGTSFISQAGYSHARGTGYQDYALDRVRRSFTLDMYVPGGYGPDFSLKNKLAWDGALELSVSLGLPLKKISGLIPDNFAQESKPSQIATLPISTKSIVSFLDRQAHRLDLSPLESLGLPAKAFAKYMAFFR